jgi:hypothetical protein
MTGVILLISVRPIFAEENTPSGLIKMLLKCLAQPEGSNWMFALGGAMSVIIGCGVLWKMVVKGFLVNSGFLRPETRYVRAQQIYNKMRGRWEWHKGYRQYQRFYKNDTGYNYRERWEDHW